ncbi:MAG: Asp-tRNA(Asn)/Glu-tRNA(Gln) amidotransferase subunit GatC [Bacillota bacterium]
MTTPDDVKKLAALSRVSIPEDRLAGFASEFEAILAYVGKLSELSLPKGGGRASAVRNAFREDGEPHEKGKYTEALVDQFPDRDGNSLRVKQIISHD